MPLTLHSQIQWSPEFSVLQTNKQEILLLSENGYHLLRNDHIVPYLSYLHKQPTLKSLLSNVSDSEDKLRLINTLNTLHENRLITTLPDHAETLYVTPRTTNAPIRIPNYPQDIFWLSELDYDNYCYNLTTILKRIGSWSENLTIIVLDDYLDPRLTELNKQCKQDKQHWLPIKLSGETPMCGPLITFAENSACWHCLTYRIKRNQPVRTWLTTQGNIDHIHIPALKPPSDSKAFSSLLTHIVANPEAVHSFSYQNNTVEQHTVHHRPSCQQCGDGLLTQRQLNTKVSLDNCKKIENHDGGYRVQPAHETLIRLAPYISALTGLVTSFSAYESVTQTASTTNKINLYCSTFFKIPPSDTELSSDSFTQHSLGKGIYPAQSKVSAICESFERAAAQYHGDEIWIQALPKELKKRHYLPNQLAQFSPSQLIEFEKNQHKSHTMVEISAPYDDRSSITWTPSWSLTHEDQVYVPFNYCYANSPFTIETHSHWNSNGCAAGLQKEDAILQGIFELVERDATAIWWYNKVPRPIFPLENLPDEHRERIHNTLCQDWNYWVLDITHDIEIPTMVAISQHKNLRHFTLGFGCHLEPVIAAQRALTELCQLVPIREKHSSPFKFNDIQSEPFLFPSANHKTTLFKLPMIEHNDIKEDIHYCVQQLKKVALETLVICYSRPEFPVKTVKVIIPGICHIWPQYSNSRLYNTPVQLGWRDKPLNESTLNPQKLYL